jgi:LPS-assembly protein
MRSLRVVRRRGLLRHFFLCRPQARHRLALPGGIVGAEDQKMLLASDELIYNNDTGVVVATGGVQIDYGSYKLVADRVEYDQNSGRMRPSDRSR